MKILITISVLALFVVPALAQQRQPLRASTPYVVKSKQNIEDISKALAGKPGNTNQDIVAQAGKQTRIAIFHDEKREGDLNEIHDGSDDIYYVTNGTATLMLGGTLIEPNEISPGEWRAKTAVGGEKVTIKKGDLVFVPRGTRHQRTGTDKKFTMILIKVFAETQPVK